MATNCSDKLNLQSWISDVWRKEEKLHDVQNERESGPLLGKLQSIDDRIGQMEKLQKQENLQLKREIRAIRKQLSSFLLNFMKPATHHKTYKFSKTVSTRHSVYESSSFSQFSYTEQANVSESCGLPVKSGGSRITRTINVTQPGKSNAPNYPQEHSDCESCEGIQTEVREESIENTDSTVHNRIVQYPCGRQKLGPNALHRQHSKEKFKEIQLEQRASESATVEKVAQLKEQKFIPIAKGSAYAACEDVSTSEAGTKQTDKAPSTGNEVGTGEEAAQPKENAINPASGGSAYAACGDVSTSEAGTKQTDKAPSTGNEVGTGEEAAQPKENAFNSASGGSAYAACEGISTSQSGPRETDQATSTAIAISIKHTGTQLRYRKLDPTSGGNLNTEDEANITSESGTEMGNHTPSSKILNAGPYPHTEHIATTGDPVPLTRASFASVTNTETAATGINQTDDGKGDAAQNRPIQQVLTSEAMVSGCTGSNKWVKGTEKAGETATTTTKKVTLAPDGSSHVIEDAETESSPSSRPGEDQQHQMGKKVNNENQPCTLIGPPAPSSGFPQNASATQEPLAAHTQCCSSTQQKHELNSKRTKNEVATRRSIPHISEVTKEEIRSKLPADCHFDIYGQPENHIVVRFEGVEEWKVKAACEGLIPVGTEAFYFNERLRGELLMAPLTPSCSTSVKMYDTGEQLVPMQPLLLRLEKRSEHGSWVEQVEVHGGNIYTVSDAHGEVCFAVTGPAHLFSFHGKRPEDYDNFEKELYLKRLAGEQRVICHDIEGHRWMINDFWLGWNPERGLDMFIGKLDGLHFKQLDQDQQKLLGSTESRHLGELINISGFIQNFEQLDAHSEFLASVGGMRLRKLESRKVTLSGVDFSNIVAFAVENQHIMKGFSGASVYCDIDKRRFIVGQIIGSVSDICGYGRQQKRQRVLFAQLTEQALKDVKDKYSNAITSFPCIPGIARKPQIVQMEPQLDSAIGKSYQAPA